MKVNYQERIEDTVTELKIIMSQQRTITNLSGRQVAYKADRISLIALKPC
jgi:hypothetical protein